MMQVSNLKRRAIWLPVLVVFLLVVGIVGSVSTGQADGPAADPAAIFPVETIAIETAGNRFILTVEIADEAHEREQGLMFREQMRPTHGMLFDFGRSGPVSMWMANTHLALDMVFIEEDGRIARIEANTTPMSRRVINSGFVVSHVLEINAGMARQMGLKPGDRIVHSSFKQ